VSPISFVGSSLLSSLCRAASGAVDPHHPADPILVHPDIRRMLLTQKAIAEGGRAMIYSCALVGDQVRIISCILHTTLIPLALLKNINVGRDKQPLSIDLSIYLSIYLSICI
jgi:alkylation response protein AidB-like acyl-CoA dehydrogenase